MNVASEISPLIRELSAYLAGALKRKLPKEVAERARLHTLDTFAAMMSGSRLAPGKSAIAYVKSRGGPREAGVTLKDGRGLAQETMTTGSGFEAPVERRQVREKALDLLAPIIGKHRSNALIAALLDIDNITDVRTLRPLYAL